MRERGEELAHGVSLKDETSEKRNFKQQEGYSQTEGRMVRSTGRGHGAYCPESFRKRMPVIYLRGGVGLAT